MQNREFNPSSAIPLERSHMGFGFDKASNANGAGAVEPGQPVIRAFVVHLDRARDRMPQVERLMAKLPVPCEIVEAVDGKQLTKAEIDRVYRRRLHKPAYPFEMSTGEIACFLSHRKAWATIVEQDIDAGLIFEDDVEVDDLFPAAFAAAKACLEPGAFIRFPFRMGKEHGKCVLTQGQTNVIRPVRVGLGMVAQLVTREAAVRLLEATETFDRPVDTTAQMSWLTHVSPLAVLPGGVHEISSRLGGSTIKSSRTLMERLSREVLRPLYRARIALRSRRSI